MGIQTGRLHITFKCLSVALKNMGKYSFYSFPSKWRTNNSIGNMYSEEDLIKLLLVSQINGNVLRLKIIY